MMADPEISNSDHVPGVVMDTVDEVVGLLKVLYLAGLSLTDDYQRDAILALQNVIESKLFPLSTGGQKSGFSRCSHFIGL